MADRPAFMFYAGDWVRNTKLRRCSLAARGAWVEVLCLMHDSDEYGVLRWRLKEIAKAAGVPLKFLHELVEKEVLKGSDENCPAYFFRPKHAGKLGEPIQILAETMGEPCWFSSRFVRDEYIRLKRAGNIENPSPKPPPKGGIGETFGDDQSGDHSRADPSFAVAVAFAVTDKPVVPVVIARTWWPSEAIITDLRMLHGFTGDWIDQQVPPFVEYWFKRSEEPRTSWDALFFDHCVKRSKLRSAS